MNCTSCGHQNRADARFCLGCGRELALACAACERALPADAVFCDGCGQRVAESPPSPPSEKAPLDYTPNHLSEKILQSRSALEGERKQVTVLFADVKGSMELAEVLDPEIWHEILDRLFEILADGIHRFEGNVNQYTGDGIMALFGAPIAHEDHARRACYAALHLLERLRDYTQALRRERGLDFSVRIGLHSGEVIVGKIGDDLRMDYTAQGHTVGLAARLESLAEAGRAYLSAATAEQVEGFFELEDLGSFQVKGASEAVHAYSLIGVGSFRTRFDQSRARGLTRFVGRDADMEALEAALERARVGEGGVVGVVAEAGTGKTRLCFEFLERCRAAQVPVSEGSAVAHGQHIPYLPILQIMREYFEISERDDDRAVRQKVAGRLLLLEESYRAVLPVLFDFLGVPDPANPAPELDGEQRQRQLFGVLRRLLQGATAEAPAVALIEDLHWIDGGSEAWVEEWSEAITGTHNLLIVNFRPEYQADWMHRATYRQLPIQPLGAEAIRELLDDMIGSDPSSRGLADAVHERTAGNPFYTEEMVRSLIESGHLEGVQGAYRLVTPIEKLPVPESIQSLLSSRIDRLPEREKQTLQTAAVIGKEFTESILTAIAELPTRDLTESLAALRSGGFILEQALYPEAEYRFVHPLTQLVAYESQLSPRRAGIHAATARAIEERYAEKLDEQAALLAYHWGEAKRHAEAAHWHQRAAKWVSKTRLPEALAHHRSAVDLLRDEPFSEANAALAIDARIGMLQMAWRVGLQSEIARELLDSGLELARRIGDARADVKLLLPFAVYVSLGDEPARLKHSGDALARARAANDEELVLSSLCVYVSSLFELGRYHEMIELLDPVVESPPRDPTLGNDYWGFHLYAFLVGRRGVANAFLGRFEQARRDVAREAALLRDGSSTEGLIYSHLHQVLVAETAGDAAAALQHTERVAEQSERLGTPIHRGFSLALLTSCRFLGGDVDGADAIGEEARELLREYDITSLELYLVHTRIGIAAAREDWDRAEQIAAEALPQMTDQRRHRALALVALARARVASGAPAAEVEDALAAAPGSLSIEELGSTRGTIQEVRGELAAREGRDEEARAALAEAHRIYADMGANGHAARTAASL